MELYIYEYWDGDKTTWDIVVAENPTQAKEQAFIDTCDIMGLDEEERKTVDIVIDDVYPITKYGEYSIKVVKN